MTFGCARFFSLLYFKFLILSQNYARIFVVRSLAALKSPSARFTLLHGLKLAIAYPCFHAALAQKILTGKRRALSGCIYSMKEMGFPTDSHVHFEHGDLKCETRIFKGGLFFGISVRLRMPSLAPKMIILGLCRKIFFLQFTCH